MTIKSKKWYQNQIKALENATDRIHLQCERLADIYRNDLAELFKAQKPLIQKSDLLRRRLYKLQDEYYLYYR